MATIDDLVQATRRHLFSGQSEELNRLDTGITSAATSLTLEFSAGGVQAGATIAIGLEEMHVWEVVGQTVTVERGFNGSIPSSHSKGDIITVQPKFSNFRIFEAIKDDLRDLSSPGNDLYQIKTVDLTATGSQYGYDLTGTENAEVLDVYEVRYKSPGPEETWPRIRNWSLARNMDTDEFASGTALILHEAPYPGQPIRVRYKAPFTMPSNLESDPEDDCGLQSTMLDLPPIGAAIRLMSPRDIKRSFSESQGEPRRADEVPVGAALTSMRGLLALRLQRIQAEAGRLQRMYPTQR